MTEDTRILLLEDDEDLREMLEEVLSDEGYQVTAVGSGEAAVEQASSQAFHLIIADIRMEGMGGLEAIKHTQELQPDIGSMVVSGYATERETAKAQRLNVGAYLKKPFKTQALLQHVRSLLGQDGQKEKKLQEDRAVWEALDWSLQAMASALDESKLYSGSLRKAAQKAEALSLRVGATPQEAKAAKRAALMLGYCQNSSNDLPEFLSRAKQQLGPLVLLLQEARSDSPPGEKSRTSQAILLALDSEFGESTSPSQLSQVHAPELVELLERNESQPSAEVDAPTGPSSQSSLLILAKTLERVGDTSNASKAFQSLVEAPKAHKKEKLEGYLGQARVAAFTGDSSKCREACLSALRAAKDLGPLSLSDAGLEAALLLDLVAAEEASKAFELVAKSLTGLDLVVREALLHIARGPLEESQAEPVIRTLTQASAYNEIARYTSCLFPKLFSRVEKGENSLRALLIRLVRDFPKDFLGAFAPGRTSSASRVAVAQCLAQSRFLPPLVLENFRAAPEPELRELEAKFATRAARENPGNLIRLYSFGEMELLTQGQPLGDKDWKTRKVKYLFSHLALNWGKAISDELLLEAFWPKDQARTKKNLYWACTALRGLLRKLNPSLENPIIRSHESVSLDPQTPHWHDLEEFRKAAQMAKQQEKAGHLEQARGYLRLASRLYRGPYLEGCYYDFAVKERELNEQRALQVFMDAAKLALQAEDNEEALEHATAAADLSLYNQETTALKMRAHLRLDQGPAALEQFQKLESFLKQEYEMEPATSLLELYHRARLGFGCP